MYRSNADHTTAGYDRDDIFIDDGLCYSSRCEILCSVWISANKNTGKRGDGGEKTCSIRYIESKLFRYGNSKISIRYPTLSVYGTKWHHTVRGFYRRIVCSLSWYQTDIFTYSDTVNRNFRYDAQRYRYVAQSGIIPSGVFLVEKCVCCLDIRPIFLPSDISTPSVRPDSSS